MKPSAPIRTLFVGHEATRTGAPIGFLRLIEWLRDSDIVTPVQWLRHGGPLVEDHRALAALTVGAADPAEVPQVQLACLNTATLGGFAEALHTAGIPVLCLVHEMDSELNRTSARNLYQLRHCVTSFIACSEAVKESLMRRVDVPAEMISVVHECVDIERALRLAAEPPALPLAKGGNLRLLCGMGTVNWRKGVDLFLRVLAHLVEEPEAGVEWHGLWISDLESGPDRDTVKHDLRVLGLEQRVTFTGSLVNPFPLLAQADVFCLTSREDPYPLAMVEAAALGIPVIGFQGTGGVEEFVAQAGGCIVPYADAAAMARAARQAALTTTEPARRAHGLAAARRLCSPNVVGGAVARIIQSLALPAPVPLSAATIAALQAAAEPTSTTRVRLLPATGAAQPLATLEWEGPPGTLAELKLPWPQNDEGQWMPLFTLSLEPQGRTTIVRGLRIEVELSDPGQSETIALIFKERSGGVAVSLSEPGRSAWLLCDGRARLHAELTLPPSLRDRESVSLRVSWVQQTDVKSALRQALHQAAPPPEPGPAWWRKLLRIG